MLTTAGKFYRIRFATFDVAQGTDPSWIVGPLTARYPAADVVSVGSSAAVLRWRGAPTEIREGERIDASMPGMPASGAGGFAVVVGIDDLGTKSPEDASSAGNVWRMVGAGALLATVYYLASRIDARVGRRAGAAA